MTIKDQIRAAMRAQNLRVEEVAVKAGLCSATVYAALAGRREVRIGTLEALATALDVTLAIEPDAGVGQK